MRHLALAVLLLACPPPERRTPPPPPPPPDPSRVRLGKGPNTPDHVAMVQLAGGTCPPELHHLVALPLQILAECAVAWCQGHNPLRVEVLAAITFASEKEKADALALLRGKGLVQELLEQPGTGGGGELC